MVKKAACLANYELGHLNATKKDAICAACDEIILENKLMDQFPVDLIQGGAGTSTNMNANEVIANRGLEIMGKKKGEYQFLHPNNDVNMSQSTNDVYPTAARLAMVFSDDPLVESVRGLMAAFASKAVEFDKVLKLGRTQLQDAGKFVIRVAGNIRLLFSTCLIADLCLCGLTVPMTLGQEFRGWSETLGKDLDRMEELAHLFAIVNLGGTAIGTGINTDPKYTTTVIRKLQEVSGIAVKSATNLIDASSDMGDFMIFSGMLRRLAVKLSKIANDLRLLSSGPRGGLHDMYVHTFSDFTITYIPNSRNCFNMSLATCPLFNLGLALCLAR